MELLIPRKLRWTGLRDLNSTGKSSVSLLSHGMKQKGIKETKDHLFLPLRHEGLGSHSFLTPFKGGYSRQVIRAHPFNKDQSYIYISFVPASTMMPSPINLITIEGNWCKPDDERSIFQRHEKCADRRDMSQVVSKVFPPSSPSSKPGSTLY